MGKTFSRFGKYSVIILLNILHIPLACTSSHSSMTMILRFGFLWSHWVISYSFHSSWIVWLRFLLFFFFNFYFIFKLWYLVFCLF
jgi:hypothetical protein